MNSHTSLSFGPAALAAAPWDCDVAATPAGLFAAIATPALYRQQPFRLTGLPVLANARDTAKRLELLRQSLALGLAEYHWAFAPSFAPTADEFVAISQVLKDARQRFAYEFFWFWPASYPEVSPDPALQHLERDETEPALAHWRMAAEAGSAVAQHNLAVYFHVQALAGERIWPAHDDTRRDSWQTAFAHWQRLATNDDFWALISRRLMQLDDPQLPPDLGDDLRRALLPAIAGINAQLAAHYSTRDNTPLARWHAELLQQIFGGTFAGAQVLANCGRVLTGQLETRRAETARDTQADPARGLAATRPLLELAMRQFDLISRACGGDSTYLRELSTSTATTTLDALVDYQRATGDNAACLPCLRLLQTWSVSPELAARIEQAHAIMSEAGTSAEPSTPAALALSLGEHRLTLDATGVQFDEWLIAIDELGGFRHAPASAEAGLAPLLAWWSPACAITLDDPALLPADDAGAARYARIVEACERWLVPPLVARLTETIRQGGSLEIGAVTLTAEGICLAPAHGETAALVPYAAARLLTQDDHLLCSSAADTSVSVAFSPREDWNVVLLPPLLAALATP